MVEFKDSGPYGQRREFQSHFRSTKSILGWSENIFEAIDQSKCVSYRRRQSSKTKPRDALLQCFGCENAAPAWFILKTPRAGESQTEKSTSGSIEEGPTINPTSSKALTRVIESQMQDNRSQQMCSMRMQDCFQNREHYQLSQIPRTPWA